MLFNVSLGPTGGDDSSMNLPCVVAAGINRKVSKDYYLLSTTNQ